jgi:glycosyltransferase involved in cell wall biosynthesis
MECKSLVSVVIPCYNHEGFIEETISSIAQSTYSNIEIIVVNDGSTDRSEDKVKSLMDQLSNLKYYLQKNSGPAAARNCGIRESNGEYILPLDADDLISPDYIEKAVEILDNQQEVKVVYCEAEFFGERSGRWKLPVFSIKKLAMDNMIFCSALYRKTDWLSAGGYSDEMTWGWEDWEFWISLLKNGGKVVKLPDTGFFYRVRKGSRRKSTNKEAKLKTIELINRKHKDFVYKHLQGPLRLNRSWSSMINRFVSIFSHY